MRQVQFKKRATNAIERVCGFIEERNLPGSSAKWYRHLIQYIIKRAGTSTVKFKLCSHPKFAAKGFSCFIYKKQWVVVFKYTDKKLTVYKFVHGSRLR